VKNCIVFFFFSYNGIQWEPKRFGYQPPKYLPLCPTEESHTGLKQCKG